jgi:cellulose synthase (UDP-forming)
MPPPAVEAEPARRKNRVASVVIPILLAGCILFPTDVQAFSQLQSQALNAQSKNSGGIDPANFHDDFELGIAGETNTLSLQGGGASLNFFFGEPVTKVTTKAQLKLTYSAPSLRANEARLELTLNGAEVGTIILSPGPMQEAELALPTDLLSNDNTLSFQLQGTCASCTAKHTPWVNLDPRSSINLSGTRLPLANDLSLLPLPFFDPSGLRSWSLPVVFGETPDNLTLQSAALVASRFGVLSDVRGVHFPVSVGEFTNGNALVFAHRSSPLLSGLSLPSEPGPLLAMRENPHDPYGKLLIVTGESSDDLLIAARALSTANWMPRVASLNVRANPLSELQAYDAPRWLNADKSSAIGSYTTAERLKLQGTGSINLYFRLPPDLFLRAQQSVPLLLKYQYAGVPAGSRAALHVRLNGKDVDSIHLKPTLSPDEESVVVRLSTGNFLAYANTLTVDFYFERNMPPSNVRPSFAIKRDSSLDLRGIPHSVVLPRLELFADAGYPFTRWPDLSRTAVIMPNAATPPEYEALLNMAGFFGAQTGALASRLTVADSGQMSREQDKDVVLIGAPDSQPLISDWGGAMPLALSGGMRVNESAASKLLLHPEWPFRESDGNQLRRSFGNGAKFDLLLESFVSPLRPDRVVVAIIPTGPVSVNAVRSLFTPSERQGPVYGGVTVSRNGRFESFLVGTQAYRAGKLNRYQHCAVLLIENYRVVPLLVILLAVMIVAWVHWSTERVAERRLTTWES